MKIMAKVTPQKAIAGFLGAGDVVHAVAIDAAFADNRNNPDCFHDRVPDVMTPSTSWCTP